MPQTNDIYQPTIAGVRGDMVQPGNKGERIRSGFGDASRELAAGFDFVSDMATKELDTQSRTWAANASSQADIAAQQMLEAKKRSATDGAPKFKESVFEDWKKYEDETLKNAPNGITGNIMRTHFAAVRESLGIKADEFQNQETDRWTAKMADDGVDADARLISTQSPEEINQSVEKSLGKWNAYYKTLPMQPDKRQALVDGTREKITNAANMREIQLDPSAYLAANAGARKQEALIGDPKAPRGIRNNNPGNLRSSEFKGTVGVDADGYGKFESPESGLRAMAKNLLVQQEKHGLNTVESIITKYAPPSENNTAAYISTVAAAIGVGPADKLNLRDPETMQKLMGAMIQQENGVQPYSPLQIQHGVEAAIEGKSVAPLNGKTPDEGGRVITGRTAFSLGTWEQQQKWINLAETEQRRVEAERKQKVTEANTLMAGAKERMQAGLPLPEEEMTAITAQVASTGDAAAAKRWSDLQATQTLTQSMQQLSPAQLSTVINTQLEPMAHRDGATEREFMQLEIGQKLLTTMTEKVKNDPISWAAQTGMQVAPLDFNKPETLPVRVANAEAVAEKYGIPVESAIFSQAEKVQFSTAIEQMPDTMKLELGKRMQKGFGPYFMKAVGELSAKDPIFSHAAFLSGLSPANDGLALDILGGQRILKENPNMKPKNEDKQPSLGELGNVFEYMPSAMPGVVAAADALYVKRVGMVDSFDQNAYDQALNDVIGKTRDGGGVATMNGAEYLLPQQFDEDDFERGIQAMTPEELAQMSVVSDNLKKTGPVNPSPPIYGKKRTPVNGAELMRNLTLKSVAYGQYAAFDDKGQRITSDTGPKGQFILSIDPAKFRQIISRANEREAEIRQMRMGGI